MKYLLLVLLVSLPLMAQTPGKSIKQLEEINSNNSTVACAENEEGHYSPQQALKNINSGKLTFLGRDIFPGSGQNYTCVYKSDTAYILYNNCMGNKKESSALDIEVIAFTGGMASFFVQNAKAIHPVSATLRANYDMTWRVSAAPSDAVMNNLTISDLKKYMDKHHALTSGCSVGSTFKAQDMNSKPFCYGGAKDLVWMTEAEKFWKEPGEDWYNTQKYLRKVVESSKF